MTPVAGVACPGPRRPNVLEVSLAAIAENVTVLKQAVGPARTVIGVLKADAYGYGAVAAARTMAAAGIDAVALADPDRAVAIRQAGVRIPILLYAGARWSEELVELIEANELTATIDDLDTIATIDSCAKGRIEAYVKLDVGLERIGIYPERVGELIAGLNHAAQVALVGAYAHLHVPPGEPAALKPYLDWQLERFAEATGELTRAGFSPLRRVAASSGVLWTTTEGVFDGVDPGRLLYGIGGPKDRLQHFDVRPALVALKSALTQVKAVHRREFGELSPLGRDVVRLGVMPIGLVDGMPHICGTHVLIRNRRAPLIGSPSLEYTRVDLSGHPDATVGDEVVLVGSQGEEQISADEVAAREPAWANGIVLRAASTIERRYVEGDPL